MAEYEDYEAPADPRDWLPMRPYRGRRTFEITDPVVEPLWSGERVLVHLSLPRPDSPPRIEIIDTEDADLAAGMPGLASALGDAIRATDAIIDGVISHQIDIDGTGSAPVTEVRSSPTDLLLRNAAELDVVPRGLEADPDASVGLIAFDLLWVDRSSLLEIPLLERTRLLESVVAPNELVRRSVHVRSPIGSWLATWKSMGLRGAMLKAANSRYRPGTDTIEWRAVEKLGKRR